jgi:adenylate kinase
MDLLTVIFLGRSGCGKGTQIEKLIELIKSKDKRSIFHLEAGARFRSFIKEGSYASGLAQKINDVGGLQPEFLAVWAWGGEIVRHLRPNQHLLIDGTPRRLNEAKVLGSALNFFERGKVAVVYLNVSREWSINRMTSRGRADDKDVNSLDEKMRWFEKDVSPIVDYYRDSNEVNFYDINGEQSVEKVHTDIVRSLGI